MPFISRRMPMVNVAQYGLGRIYSPDPNDCKFLARDRLEAKPQRAKSLMYHIGPIIDQGQTPKCVGFSGRNLLTSSPHAYTADLPDGPAIYTGAQQNDDQPGENYDGTTVRGGAKFLQGAGLITGDYLWAYDVDTVLDWILTGKGCVWFGTNWYTSMFSPNARTGLISKISGNLEGGHAYLARGADQKYVYFVNSWGSSWSLNGTFYLSHSNVNRLLKEQGEACMATELVGD
jgi:hypothetical protein